MRLRMLDPQDPLPEIIPHAVVLQRFLDDEPNRLVVELILATARRRSTRLMTRPDGTAMHFREALRSAREIVREAGLDTIHAVDRAAGPRARAIRAHGGDHATGSEKLEDFDWEDDERGPDMRDIAHPDRTARDRSPENGGGTPGA